MRDSAADEPANTDGFERVYVENDWWDGPRSGLADVEGVPHYFHSAYEYEDPDEVNDQYYVWPVEPGILALEQEHWAIFVAWNDRFEAGTATIDTHPANAGVDARADELTATLVVHRAIPAGARRVTGEWRVMARDSRYHGDGPAYRFRWREAPAS